MYAKFTTEIKNLEERILLKQSMSDLIYSGSVNDLLNINSKYNDKLLIEDNELKYIESNITSQEKKWLDQLEIKKSSEYYTVEFDTAGGNEEIENQTIRVGKKVNRPNNPTKEEYDFLGWYYLKQSGTEENPTYEEIEFDFNIPISKNYSLYAKYKNEAIMMQRNNNYAFWKDEYRTKITSITFEKGEISIPAQAEDLGSISANSNCSEVRAYVEDDGTENYKLTIKSKHTIYANQNITDYFKDFSNLQSIDFSNFDTSKVITMRHLFFNCNKLKNLELSKFDTSNVLDMSFMFNGCSDLENINISNFITNKVENMRYMFNGCSNIVSLDLSNFDTQNVTIMDSMFSNCSKINTINLSNFKTGKVTDMNAMFYNCKNLVSLNVSSFDTKNVIDMSCLFYNCNNLANLNISNFSTENVVKMYMMFGGCSSLNELNLQNFDTGNVTNMGNMFYNCINLTDLNINNFDTSNVTNMSYMFYGCKNLTYLNINGFDTKKVNNMGYIFTDCKNLTKLDISNFNTNSVSNMEAMFAGDSNLKELNLSYFDASNVTDYNAIFYLVQKEILIVTNSKFESWLNEKFPNYFTNIKIIE